MIEGFTKKYKVDRSFYYEAHSSPESAILRGKKDEEMAKSLEKATNIGAESGMERFIQ